MFQMTVCDPFYQAIDLSQDVKSHNGDGQKAESVAQGNCLDRRNKQHLTMSTRAIACSKGARLHESRDTQLQVTTPGPRCGALGPTNLKR